MPERTIKTANPEINQGSILLLFGEDDATIVRDWGLAPDPRKKVTAPNKQVLKQRKDHEPSLSSIASSAP